LNGIVFLVLGLQLPSILAGIQGESPTEVILAGALFSALVILLRMLWVFPGAWLSIRIQRLLLRRQTDAVSPRSVFLVGWAGMRGVLALAAALSLPIRLNNGAPFPQRNQIIFLTFCVIFATLVLQGLSLPMLIRRLGLAGASAGEQEESSARRQMVEAALQSLKQIREQNANGESSALSQLEEYYRRRLALLEGESADEPNEVARNAQRVRFVAQELRDVERAVAMNLRNENKIHDEALRTLERELDLADARQARSEF
ncbi:MAG TPA: cation:proton antiporter, partial [Bryobacteraceae bacterium]